MAALNRNIITATDITNYVDRDKGTPATLDVNPPAGSPPGDGEGQGGVPVPTADDYLTRLVKYIPPEVIGLFLDEGVARGSSRGWRGRRVGACGGVEVFRGWEFRHCPPS
jgi:hypothetical protein